MDEGLEVVVVVDEVLVVVDEVLVVVDEVLVVVVDEVLVVVGAVVVVVEVVVVVVVVEVADPELQPARVAPTTSKRPIPGSLRISPLCRLQAATPAGTDRVRKLYFVPPTRPPVPAK